MTSTDTSTPTPSTPRRRWGTRARLILAGVAVLGIGAAVTTAAWTDDVWFTADAEAGTVELSGSLNGTDFFPGEEGNLDLVVDLTATPLAPEAGPVSFQIWLQNDGNVPLTIGPPTVTFTGDLESCDPDATPTAVLTTVPDSLPAGDTSDPITVEISVPDDWDVACEGATGSIEIQVVGSTATA